MPIEGEIIIADSSDDRTAAIARDLGATVVRPEKRGSRAPGGVHRHGGCGQHLRLPGDPQTPRPARCRRRYGARLPAQGREPARRDARPVVLPPGWTCAPAAEDDADDLAALYGEVFATYPFPIADPGYLRATMAGDYRYFIVRTEDGRLAAASSAEIYREDENVEMTDFAVHQAFRGKNLSGLLLSRMEEEMRAAGMRIRISAPSRYARIRALPIPEPPP